MITIFRSNIPIDCHILKGRLESEGIPCFIYDENIVWVHPFRAVAVGGVKLKVPYEKFNLAKKIINLLNHGILLDENGEYNISDIFNNEIIRQNDIISLKNKIRKDPTIFNRSISVDSKWITTKDIEEIVKYEQDFQVLSNKEFKFDWKQFFYELFDFDRSIFQYFRPRPVDYYLEKEIVENYINQKEIKSLISCPNCKSGNVYFGYAIDFKWDIIFLLVSLLLFTPLFLIRKKYHCFNCGYNFNNKAATANTAYK